MATIGFIFLGGAHQVLHMAPVARELAERPGMAVSLFAASAAERDALLAWWAAAGAEAPPPVRLLATPRWLQSLLALGRRDDPGKTAKLLWWAWRLQRFDVLVAAERTSTLLKRVPGRRPLLVHIPHGAGDRAKGFERRISLFDHVLVAGEKDRDRLVREGVCAPEDVSVTGYVKLAAVRQLHARHPPPALFGNGRPTVLYNPHFDARLSSWDGFGERILAAFEAQDHFNLVIAPHVRLRDRLGAEERRRLSGRQVPGRILVDLGSAKSNDMTYTAGADIYLGDVSSQVYEFLATPRPCVFIGTAPPAADDAENYAFRRCGQTVWSPDEVLPAIGRAGRLQASYRAAQESLALAAMGDGAGRGAQARAADVIEALAVAAGPKTHFANSAR